jgi:cell division protein FtsW
MKAVEFKIRYDYWLELITLTLMAIGTVFVFSAGANVGGQYEWKRFYEFTTLKQLLFFPAAVAIMYLVSLIDFRHFSLQRNSIWKSIIPYLLVISVILLIVVLIFGQERNYSKRWLFISLGSMSLSFQPSELSKWVIIIFLAAALDRYHDKLPKFFTCFVPICVIPALSIGLIITQDFGTAAYIALMTALLLWLGGAVWWHFLTPLPIVIPGFIAAIVSSETRMNRIRHFMNPEDMLYQADQSLRTIATGGLLGKGLGRGIFKYGHLPEDTTDFIFSIICEETGFIGALLVIVLFLLFSILGIKAVMRCEDRFGRLLGLGIVLCIAIQAVVNIGVVTVVLPTKGIPLPLISAGGTSMLLTAGAMGILLNILRKTEAQLDPVDAGVFFRKD